MRLAMLVALALAGCGLRAQAPTLKQYQLAYASPDVEAPSLPVVLRVDPFGVNAAYNRDGIVWRDGPHATGTSASHRWMTTPSRMITDLIARDLAASGRYEAVVQDTAPLSAAYALGGEIEQLETDVTGARCAARLGLRVLLVRTSAVPEPLLQHRYAAEVPCDGDGPDGLVAAMSEGLRRVSAEVQRDVHAAVSRDLREAPAVAKDTTRR